MKNSRWLDFVVGRCFSWICLRRKVVGDSNYSFYLRQYNMQQHDGVSCSRSMIHRWHHTPPPTVSRSFSIPPWRCLFEMGELRILLFAIASVNWTTDRNGKWTAKSLWTPRASLFRACDEITALKPAWWPVLWKEWETVEGRGFRGLTS